MTSSMTRSQSFTVVDARYVGAKIGADLRLLHSYYGRPALTDIGDYVEETALLLRDGYLRTVDFGFRTGTSWNLRLRYTATLGGQLLDSRPGGLPEAAVLPATANFASYLTYSQKFWNLAPWQQTAVTNPLPVARTSGDEPTALNGTTTTGNGYGRNGVGVDRGLYVSR